MTPQPQATGSSDPGEPVVVRIVHKRPFGTELDEVNQLIESAIETWDLPARVKRLALPSFRYGEPDVELLGFVMAYTDDDRLVGVAAWEPCRRDDCPAGQAGLSLHGLYVRPGVHRQGIGTRLVDAVLAVTQDHGGKGLLVRAQRGAKGFFSRQGFLPLRDADASGRYPHRLWRGA